MAGGGGEPKFTVVHMISGMLATLVVTMSMGFLAINNLAHEDDIDDLKSELVELAHADDVQRLELQSTISGVDTTVARLDVRVSHIETRLDKIAPLLAAVDG